MPSSRGELIIAHLRDRQQEMISFLEALTMVESPSSVPEAQAQVQRVLASALEQLDFQARCVTGGSNVRHLYARPAVRDRHAPVQLMVGHYDTVWPVGTLQNMPFEVDGNVVKGPGVFDMKGGLTQMVFALRALRDLELQPELTTVLFVNGDEEIGSRDSGRHISRLARGANRAFVLEPSLGTSGKLKTTRKGVGRFTIDVYGKAAHAGLDPKAGVSAILELSYIIQQLFALNDEERGVTVNVGTIDGGLRPNVVAPHSRAVVDVRVRTRADGERVAASIHALQPQTPGITLDIEGAIGRPALEATPRNQTLWQVAKKLGAEINLELEEDSAGGGSDGNTTSLYTATLDGLGPVGDGAHAHHEFLYIDKTVERTALLALLLLEPPIETQYAAASANG
jgi:glutamate carboxypeptidase